VSGLLNIDSKLKFFTKTTKQSKKYDSKLDFLNLKLSLKFQREEFNYQSGRNFNLISRKKKQPLILTILILFVFL
jgi:hypothetical protein